MSKMNQKNTLQGFCKEFKRIYHKLHVKFVKNIRIILLNAFNVLKHIVQDVIMIKKMKINIVLVNVKD